MDSFEKLEKIIIVGLGYMGHFYVANMLKKGGLRQSQIVAVDVNSEKVIKFREEYPEIQCYESIDAALGSKEKATAAFVLTNTPSHHLVVSDLVKKGVGYIFVEKPLGIDSRAVALIKKNMKPETKIFTAFLMNFSGAKDYLTLFMKEKRLYLAEAMVSWGKDRTGDSRPTPGDLQDESIHGWNFCDTLTSINQERKRAVVYARVTFLPYFDQQVQKRAHELDASFPLMANSSSFITETLTTDKGRVVILIHSSFVMLRQTRKVILTLNGVISATPEWLAEINFDTKDGDILELKPVGKNKPIELLKFSGDKVWLETEAFLRFVQSGEKDSRLTGFQQAKASVDFTDAAIRSDRGGRGCQLFNS